MNIGIVSVIHYAQEMALREKEERQKEFSKMRQH